MKPYVSDSKAGLRVFAAVSLPSSVRGAIQRLQEQLRPALGSPVRWIRPEQLHLTLRFFGNVPHDQVAALSEALRASCQGTASFQLSLVGLGCFPSFPRPNIIWLGIGGDVAVLALLQNKLEHNAKTFGSHSEDRDFRPHLTIGRVKASAREGRQMGQAIQGQSLGELDRWTVHEVELIQSTLSPQGSSYRSLAAIPLVLGKIGSTSR